MVDRNVSVPACMVILPEVTSVSGSVQCFEICSTANEWNADAMARKLPTLLEKLKSCVEGTVRTALEYGGPWSGSDVDQALELDRLHPGRVLSSCSPICKSGGWSRPIDAWERAKPQAFDVTVASPLTPASSWHYVAAYTAECQKHSSNDPKYRGKVQNTFVRLASILLIFLHCPKAKVLAENHERFDISLVSTPTKSKSQQQPPHTHTPQPPSSECQNLARESKALALALTSERLSLWYKMVVACLVWMARRAASHKKDCCASMPQHPYDSTAKGMHTHPRSAHSESLALCFLASATRAEDPHLTPASVKVVLLSGEVSEVKSSRFAKMPVVDKYISRTRVQSVKTKTTSNFDLTS
ncbi:hypothetical protein EMCRGX_G015501 [Ephydatia muelleri]